MNYRVCRRNLTPGGWKHRASALSITHNLAFMRFWPEFGQSFRHARPQILAGDVWLSSVRAFGLYQGVALATPSTGQ
jgi:hypothetical protein